MSRIRNISFLSISFTLAFIFFIFVSNTHAAFTELKQCGTAGADPTNCVQAGTGTGISGSSGTGVSGSGGTGISGSGGCAGGELCNPLESDTIPEFLLKIIDVILVFALPIVIFYIMYAGFLFVTSAGNSEQISSARSAFLWAVVGGIIVLGVRIIIDVIQGTVDMF